MLVTAPGRNGLVGVDLSIRDKSIRRATRLSRDERRPIQVTLANARPLMVLVGFTDCTLSMMPLVYPRFSAMGLNRIHKSLGAVHDSVVRGRLNR